MSQNVKFYFDFYSPFCYFVAEQIDQMELEQDAVFEWCPIDIERILGADKADPYNSMKRAYMNQDVFNAAAYFGLPLAFPSPFPVQSKKALALSLSMASLPQFPAFAIEVFRAAWVRSKNIDDNEVLLECWQLAGNTSSEIDSLLEESASELPSVATTTDSAMASDVFGVPMFEVEDQRLFGSDRFPMLKMWLTDGIPPKYDISHMYQTIMSKIWTEPPNAH